MFAIETADAATRREHLELHMYRASAGIQWQHDQDGGDEASAWFTIPASGAQWDLLFLVSASKQERKEAERLSIGSWPSISQRTRADTASRNRKIADSVSPSGHVVSVQSGEDQSRPGCQSGVFVVVVVVVIVVVVERRISVAGICRSLYLM